MPKININEREDITFASFDATENVALVPIVYIRHKDKDVLPKPTVYTNATTFKDSFVSHCGWLETNSEGIGTVIDRTYLMIYELLLQRMSVLVVPIDGGLHSDSRYPVSEAQNKQLISDFIDSSEFDIFKDRNIYNIKFITTGAYSNIDTSAYSKLVRLAEDRGDAIALLELPQEAVSVEDIRAYTQGLGNDISYRFSAITYPWCTFTTTGMNEVDEVTMPGSFAYLMAYANSVKTNSNWFAAAGTMRGAIPNLISTKVDVGEALMHLLQNDEGYVYEDPNDPNSNYVIGVNINPVYNAGAYGYRIWGNRVAWKKSTAQGHQYMEYLNVRVLMCDIKKQIFHAAMRVTFEPNDDIVWYNFKSLANSLLDKMKSGRGVKWYKWTKEATTSAEKALIKATLTIQPIEAVESFDINIILTDRETTVGEGE